MEAAPVEQAAMSSEAARVEHENEREHYRRFFWFIGACWLSTNLAYGFYDLPLRFFLKEQLHLSAAGQSLFLAIGHFTNYVKPLAGIFTDAVPVFGTRRRHYLLISLTVGAIGWIALGIVAIIHPTYGLMLTTYTLLYIAVVFISTTLGGVMAEGGERFRATGRLSAQRIAIFRVGALVGGPVGGWLATKSFMLTMSLTASFHLLLIPLILSRLHEPPTAHTDTKRLQEMKRQAIDLFHCKPLWCAAGLVVLIMAAPGFGTPLLYYQTDKLHFGKEFIGWLRFMEGACGILGALIFSTLCRRANLRALLAMSILTHTFFTLAFLGYRSPISAFAITGLYHMAQTLAVLPLYDLAMRATPKGSEAMGYSVMMSVWNLTLAVSDLTGSMLLRFIGFNGLILLNAGTTALVLFAIPMLPPSLTLHREGQPGPPVTIEPLLDSELAAV